MVFRAILLSSLALIAASCAASPNKKIIEPVNGQAPQLVGRWIFSPGDSSISQDPKAVKQDDAIESPIGSSLSLGEGGIMTARAADFVRRGTWKISMGSLKLIIDPPPERRELTFVPLVELDRLTLTGTDGVVLVYQRDTFIALPNTSPVVPETKNPNDAAPSVKK
jgi:hypothetical protein